MALTSGFVLLRSLREGDKNPKIVCLFHIQTNITHSQEIHLASFYIPGYLTPCPLCRDEPVRSRWQNTRHRLRVTSLCCWCGWVEALWPVATVSPSCLLCWIPSPHRVPFRTTVWSRCPLCQGQQLVIDPPGSRAGAGRRRAPRARFPPCGQSRKAGRAPSWCFWKGQCSTACRNTGRGEHGSSCSNKTDVDPDSLGPVSRPADGRVAGTTVCAGGVVLPFTGGAPSVLRAAL